MSSSHTIDYSPADFERKFGSPQADPALVSQLLAQLTKNVAGTSPAWHGDVAPLPSLSPEDEVAATFSHGTEALNCLLRFAGFSPKLRPIFDTLIGIAGEHITKRFADLAEDDDRADRVVDWDAAWFEATRSKIGQASRIVLDNIESSNGAAEQWAGRNLKALKLAQQERNFAFVEIEEGDFDRATWRNRPTRFRLPALKLVIKTLRAAHAKSYFSRQPNYAISEAAREILNSVPDMPYIRERRERRALDPKSRLAANRKRMLTLLKKCREDLALCAADARFLGDDTDASLTPEGWLENLLADEVKVFDEADPSRSLTEVVLSDEKCENDAQDSGQTGYQTCTPSDAHEENVSVGVEGVSNVYPIGAKRHEGVSNLYPVTGTDESTTNSSSHAANPPPNAAHSPPSTVGHPLPMLPERETCAVGVSTDQSFAPLNNDFDSTYTEEYPFKVEPRLPDGDDEDEEEVVFTC